MPDEFFRHIEYTCTKCKDVFKRLHFDTSWNVCPKCQNKSDNPNSDPKTLGLE